MRSVVCPIYDFRAKHQIDRQLSFTFNRLFLIFLRRWTIFARHLSDSRDGKAASTKRAGWKRGSDRKAYQGRLETHVVLEISKKASLFSCISRAESRFATASTLHRALFNGRFFALFGRLINRGASRLYFTLVLRCTGEPWLVVPEGGTQERERKRERTEGGDVAGGMKWSGREWRAREDVQSRRCIMNRTPAPPGPPSAFTETPLISP